MTRAEKTVDVSVPDSQAEAAELLARASGDGLRVRLCGARTKLDWAAPVHPVDFELCTRGLDTIAEHNEGDLTAVLEPGVRLADAQSLFERAGQRLSVDPPLGPGSQATVGGVLASGESGPLRNRYGAARDLVVGMTVALSDGTIAKSGGKVIKNVAGYDLGKLFTGSFGTLGLICEVCVRLHPLPRPTVTLSASSGDADVLAEAAGRLSHATLEKECLDLRFAGREGSVLARFAGVTARTQAEAGEGLLAGLSVDTEITDSDDGLWAAQREAQRSADRCVVRVSGLQTDLAPVARACERMGARCVGRAGLGIYWITLGDSSPDAIAQALFELRTELSPAACVVRDCPSAARQQLDVWGPVDPAVVALARQVKERFDPAGTCNPQIFVGGI